MNILVCQSIQQYIFYRVERDTLRKKNSTVEPSLSLILPLFFFTQSQLELLSVGDQLGISPFPTSVTSRRANQKNSPLQINPPAPLTTNEKRKKGNTRRMERLAETGGSEWRKWTANNYTTNSPRPIESKQNSTKNRELPLPADVDVL